MFNINLASLSSCLHEIVENLGYGIDYDWKTNFNMRNFSWGFVAEIFSGKYKRWSQHWNLLQSSSSLRGFKFYLWHNTHLSMQTHHGESFLGFLKLVCRSILENEKGCNSFQLFWHDHMRLLKFLNVTITTDKILCHLIYLSWIREYWKDLFWEFH